MRALILPAALASVLMGSACTVVNPPPAVVTPVATQAPAPQSAYCREYTATAVVDGKPQQTVGTACQQPDGRWQIVAAAPANEPAAAPPPTVAYPTYYYAYPYYPYPYYPYWGPSF